MAGALIASLRIWSGASPVIVIIFVFLIGFYIVTYLYGINFATSVDLGLLPRVNLGASGPSVATLMKTENCV